MGLLDLVRSFAAGFAASFLNISPAPIDIPGDIIQDSQPIPILEEVIPEPKYIILPEWKPLLQTEGEIVDVLHDNKKNTFFITYDATQGKLFIYRSNRNKAQKTESITFSKYASDLSAHLAPDNKIYFTWIEAGQVHLGWWSSKTNKLSNLQNNSKEGFNISGGLAPYNKQPQVFFDRLGALYLSWIHNPAGNVPPSFHTQSVEHHDFYITMWDGENWKKLDGRDWFERFSDYFPSPTSVYQYDISFDADNQPLVVWTRPAVDLGYESSTSIFFTRYNEKYGWHGLTSTDKVIESFAFPGLIENIFVDTKNNQALIGWDSSQISGEQIEPQTYVYKNNTWKSLSPSIDTESSQRFELHKQPSGILLISHKPEETLFRRYKNNTWRQLNGHINTSPYLTSLPKLPHAQYFVSPRDEIFGFSDNTFWFVEYVQKETEPLNQKIEEKEY